MLVSFAFLIFIFTVLQRRRRNLDRAARAHESFGPGVGPRQARGGSGGRHASRPSVLPFLGGLRRSEDSNESGARAGVFSRLGGMFQRGNKVQLDASSASNAEKGLGFGAGMDNEKALGTAGLSAYGPGQHLPPVDIDVATPLLDSDPFADSHSTEFIPALPPPSSLGFAQRQVNNVLVAPFAERQMAAPAPAVPVAPKDPFWSSEDLLPPAMRTSDIKRVTAAAAAASSVNTNGILNNEVVLPPPAQEVPVDDPFMDYTEPQPAFLAEPSTPSQRSETGEKPVKPGYVSWVTASGWSYGNSSPPSTATVSRPTTRVLSLTALPTETAIPARNSSDVRNSVLSVETEKTSDDARRLSGISTSAPALDAIAAADAAATARLSGFSQGSDITMEAQTEAESEMGHEQRMSVGSFNSLGASSTTSRYQVRGVS